ncbi:hypothetical protein HYE43_00900 [Mycoplasmopsis bovis]|nr:hypothetical protein [Mycoplasmopsis bovis]QQH20138.1 hypothetical protein HYE43_00900 [Mycoplasmopsis bovis]
MTIWKLTFTSQDLENYLSSYDKVTLSNSLWFELEEKITKQQTLSKP